MPRNEAYSLPGDALQIIRDHPSDRQAVVKAPSPIVCTWYRVLNGYVFSTREGSWLVSLPGRQACMLEVTYGD